MNGLVHGVVRDCGIVHGESEKLPVSPSEIRPGVMDDGSRAVRLDVLSEPSLLFTWSLGGLKGRMNLAEADGAASLSDVGTCRNLVISSERIPDARGIFGVRCAI